MTKDRRVGIAECPQKAPGLGILVQTESAVNARYDKVEPRQDIIGVIKGTVGQNIGFDALEYAKLAPTGRVQPIDFFVLALDFCDAETACVVGRLGMIGYAEI